MTRNDNTGKKIKYKINRDGYWYIRIGGKYIAEHRLIIENYIGRKLTSKEVVHHINGDKRDNRIKNLEVFPSKGTHSYKAHPYALKNASKKCLGRRPKNWNRVNKFCPTCRKTFETTAGISGKKFCSVSCASSYPGRNRDTSGLKLGRGWNKGKPMTWAKRGKNSSSYKHGKYSKYA